MTPRGPILSSLALAKGDHASKAQNNSSPLTTSPNGPYGTCDIGAGYGVSSGRNLISGPRPATWVV